MKILAALGDALINGPKGVNADRVPRGAVGDRDSSAFSRLDKATENLASVVVDACRRPECTRVDVGDAEPFRTAGQLFIGEIT